MSTDIDKQSPNILNIDVVSGYWITYNNKKELYLVDPSRHSNSSRDPVYIHYDDNGNEISALWNLIVSLGPNSDGINISYSKWRFTQPNSIITTRVESETISNCAFWEYSSNADTPADVASWNVYGPNSAIGMNFEEVQLISSIVQDETCNIQYLSANINYVRKYFYDDENYSNNSLYFTDTVEILKLIKNWTNFSNKKVFLSPNNIYFLKLTDTSENQTIIDFSYKNNQFISGVNFEITSFIDETNLFTTVSAFNFSKNKTNIYYTTNAVDPLTSQWISINDRDDSFINSENQTVWIKTTSYNESDRHLYSVIKSYKIDDLSILDPPTSYIEPYIKNRQYENDIGHIIRRYKYDDEPIESLTAYIGTTNFDYVLLSSIDNKNYFETNLSSVTIEYPYENDVVSTYYWKCCEKINHQNVSRSINYTINNVFPTPIIEKKPNDLYGVNKFDENNNEIVGITYKDKNKVLHYSNALNQYNSYGLWSLGEDIYFISSYNKFGNATVTSLKIDETGPLISIEKISAYLSENRYIISTAFNDSLSTEIDENSLLYQFTTTDNIDSAISSIGNDHILDFSVSLSKELKSFTISACDISSNQSIFTFYINDFQIPDLLSSSKFTYRNNDWSGRNFLAFFKNTELGSYKIRRTDNSWQTTPLTNIDISNGVNIEMDANENINIIIFNLNNQNYSSIISARYFDFLSSTTISAYLDRNIRTLFISAFFKNNTPNAYLQLLDNSIVSSFLSCDNNILSASYNYSSYSGSGRANALSNVSIYALGPSNDKTFRKTQKTYNIYDIINIQNLVSLISTDYSINYLRTLSSNTIISNNVNQISSNINGYDYYSVDPFSNEDLSIKITGQSTDVLLTSNHVLFNRFKKGYVFNLTHDSTPAKSTKVKYSRKFSDFTALTYSYKFVSGEISDVTDPNELSSYIDFPILYTTTGSGFSTISNNKNINISENGWIFFKGVQSNVPNFQKIVFYEPYHVTNIDKNIPIIDFVFTPERNIPTNSYKVKIISNESISGNVSNINQNYTKALNNGNFTENSGTDSDPLHIIYDTIDKNGTYTYTIRDFVGNDFIVSSFIIDNIDTEAPYFELVSVKPKSYLQSYTLGLSAWDSDIVNNETTKSGISHVHYSTNVDSIGGNVIFPDNCSLSTLTLNKTKPTIPFKTIFLNSIDKAGNESEIQSFYFQYNIVHFNNVIILSSYIFDNETKHINVDYSVVGESNGDNWYATTENPNKSLNWIQYSNDNIPRIDNTNFLTIKYLCHNNTSSIPSTRFTSLSTKVLTSNLCNGLSSFIRRKEQNGSIKNEIIFKDPLIDSESKGEYYINDVKYSFLNKTDIPDNEFDNEEIDSIESNNEEINSLEDVFNEHLPSSGISGIAYNNISGILFKYENLNFDFPDIDTDKPRLSSGTPNTYIISYPRNAVETERYYRVLTSDPWTKYNDNTGVVLIENTNLNLRYKINNGYYPEYVEYYDFVKTTSPEIKNITVSPNSLTCGNVIVRADFVDEGGTPFVSQYKISGEENFVDYPIAGINIEENCTVYFYAKDEYDNFANSSIKVTNIDKILPTIRLEFSPNRYQRKEDANEVKIIPIIEDNIAVDYVKTKYTFSGTLWTNLNYKDANDKWVEREIKTSQNLDELTFEIYDTAGNKALSTIPVRLFDDDLPTIEISATPSNETWTNRCC